jgi:hypothetical protein
VAEAAKPAAVEKKPDIGSTQPIEMLPETALLGPMDSNVSTPASAEKIDLGSTQPLGTLAQELENSLLPLLELPADIVPPVAAVKAATIQAPVAVEDAAPTLEIPGLVEMVRAAEAPVPTAKPVVAEKKAATIEPMPPASNLLTEFGELALLATGEWQAMQSADVKSDAKKSDTAATGELNGPETLSLISNPAPSAKAESADPTLQLALLPDPAVEPKRAVNGQ